MTFQVIDAHAHLFPDEIRLDRHRFRARDEWFSSLFDEPVGGMATAEELIASMDLAGIERTIVCGWPWREPAICALHNDYLADVAKRFPDRISWLGIISPVHGGAAAEIARCVDLGAIGIGELNADAQGFAWESTPGLANMAEACTSLNVPMLMHCSEPVGHDYLGKGAATPDRILVFLRNYPDLKVVCAHWGGGLPFYELMPEVAALTGNVVYDTAASTYLYGFDVFHVIEHVVGAERILFGSDFPVLKQKRFLDRARAATTTSANAESIFAGNARRVFGLDESL